MKTYKTYRRALEEAGKVKGGRVFQFLTAHKEHYVVGTVHTVVRVISPFQSLISEGRALPGRSFTLYHGTGREDNYENSRG